MTKTLRLPTFPHVLSMAAIALTTWVSVPAKAEPPAVVVSRFEEALDLQAQRLARIPIDERNEACDSRYARIWADGRLRIDWFYGYLHSETADVVSDRLVRFTTAHVLMKPCSDGVMACGFTKVADLTDDDGPVVLEKTLADGRAVEIRLWNSASKDWNSRNTVGVGHVFVANKVQEEKTNKVWAAFLASFREAPIVIYDGHSEFGKGPGFAPMSWIDYAYNYLANGPKQKKVMKALKKPGKQPEVFMIAACESKKYYLEKYRKVLPQTAIVATDKAQEFAVGESTVYGFVDSIMTGRCEAGIEESLIPSTGVDAGADIYGFEMPGL